MASVQIKEHEPKGERCRGRNVNHLHIDEELAAALGVRGEEYLLRRLKEHSAAVCPSCRDTLRSAGLGSGSQGLMHFTRADFDALLKEDTDPLPMRLLLHLASCCPGCERELGDLAALYEEGFLPADFIVTELDLFLGRSRQEAPALLGEILSFELDEAKAKAERDERFHSWGLAEALCKKSHEVAGQNPERSLHIGNLAKACAERISCPVLPSDCIFEIRMLAEAHAGNALRNMDELRCARKSFQKAEALWANTQAQLFPYRERVLSLRASLEIDERQFEEALDSLAEGLELVRVAPTEDSDLLAILLIQKYLIQAYSGQELEAVNSLDEAAKILEPFGPSRLSYIVLQNRLDYLSRVGKFRKADALLPQVHKMSATLGLPADTVRLAWTKGRIALGTGKPELAIKLFRAARRSFLEVRKGYDAALVSLELATAYFNQGKMEHVRRLALEMLPVFQSQDIHREAIAALALFQQAAVTEQVTNLMLRDLVTYFHKAQTNPDLRFRNA